MSPEAAWLTDFFSESDLLAALLADPHIQSVLKQKMPGQPPTNLTTLYQARRGESLEIDDCSCEFPADFLSRFVFHHLEQDRVLVLMGLPHYAEVCRGRWAGLEIFRGGRTLKPTWSKAKRLGGIAACGPNTGLSLIHLFQIHKIKGKGG
jgi:hypothetical protein